MFASVTANLFKWSLHGSYTKNSAIYADSILWFRNSNHSLRANLNDGSHLLSTYYVPDPVWKSLGHLLTLSLQLSVAILRSSSFHGWGNWLSCSLGFPILSNGKDILPLLKLSLVHCMLLIRNRSHSPMSTQKSRHHPILCSTGRSLKIGLPNSRAAPKTGPSAAYHNHLGSFWNKTQQRPGPHTLDVLGLPGALESLSSESCPGAFDTHQVWEHYLIQLAHCLVYCG